MKNDNIKNNFNIAVAKEDKELLSLFEEKNSKLHILYKQFIITFLSCILLWAGLFTILFVVKTKSFVLSIIIVITIILSLIFFIFSSFLVTVKAWLDRKKIKGRIIERISNNYVICNFWNNGKRIKKEICIIKNGNSIIHDNQLYMIQNDCIWLDERKRPNIFFYEGNALPLKINPSNVAETDSELLIKYRDSKFTEEIINGELGNKTNGVTVFLIVIGIIIVIALIFIAVKTNNGNVAIVKNVSSVMK